VTNAEREKRLAAIRWAVESGVCQNGIDVSFLLAELDAATQALHDLREERGGAAAGDPTGPCRHESCDGHPGHDWARGDGPLGEPWRVCLRCGRTEPHPGAAPETEAEPLWPTPAG
jgi:hypothetical protein